MANFFAYFDPKQRINSRDILFLICCPAHQRKDVKQELEKAGLSSCDATSRRYMIPGRDMAYVFVSGGITFASDEDIGGSYLRLVSKVRFNQKGKWLNAVSIWTRRFGYCRLHHPYRMCLKFLGTRFHCFRSFLLIWHPLFQIMRQQEQSGVPKTEATGKGPSSVVASSEAAFSDLIRMES